MQRTLVLVKPDGVRRGLCGEVIRRLERRGLRMVGCRLLQMDRDLAERHYAEHRQRPFFADLVRFITSGPVLAMVWEGPGAIAAVRALMGATDPLQAGAGTIRGDYALDIGENVVHGSADPEAAAREIALFFASRELVG
jgi:nucleoside-diphosphate kinase